MSFTNSFKDRFTKITIIVIVFLCFFIGKNKLLALDNSSIEVEDKADLLSSDEEINILNRVKQILDENNKAWYVDIFTIDDSLGKTTATYGIDRYEQINDPEKTGKVLDGFFIIIDIDNRNYHFGTFGEALRIFDVSDVDNLLDSMFDGVSSGDYYSAFNAALNNIDARLQLGDQYDSSNSISQVKNYDFITPIFIALIFGSGSAFMYFGKVVKDYDKYENKPMFNYAKNSIAEYSEFEDIISNRQSYRVYRPLPRGNISNSGRSNSYSGGSSMSGGGRNVGGGGRSF